MLIFFKDIKIISFCVIKTDIIRYHLILNSTLKLYNHKYVYVAVQK